ncbi:MAG: hypothetical protein HY561_00775 [Gemmatimonadetes bacterium]|nr:hypothetical protein [Gemmatimonadota bacterium]
MNVYMTYCAALDQQVHVTWTELPLQDGQATIPDPEPICLEVGLRCTGAFCPLFGLPAAVMEQRLLRSGLEPAH